MRGFTGEQKDFDAVSKKIGPETYTAEAKAVDRLDNTAFDAVKFIMDNFPDIQSAAGIINYSTNVLFYKYTASAGQTVFTGLDENTRELHITGNPIVFVNYIKNATGTFSTDITGTELTFNEPLQQGDIVLISSFSFDVDGGVVFDFQTSSIQGFLDSALAASSASLLAQQGAETARIAAELAYSLADAARILSENAAESASTSSSQSGAFSNSAAGHALAALNSETNATTQATLAQQSATTAAIEAQGAEASMASAAIEATNATLAQQLAESASAASAASALNAANSETQAGESASASAVHTIIAESYATASAQNATATATSASIATTKADEAGVSAAAASASQVAAGNSAGNAAASEAASAGFASTAEGHSLAAQTSSEVAARFVSGSAVPNATFSDWDGTWPDNFLVIEGGSGNTVSKNTADAKYVNAVRMEVGPTHVMLRPVLYSVTSINSGTWPITDTVKVTLELELISGDWTDVQIIGSWPAPAWNNVFKPLSPLLKPTVGLIQKIEILVEKPASVDVEDVTAIQIALYGAWASHAPKAFLVHSFNIEPVVAESIAAITKQVRADMDGIQAAAIGMRAVAGSAGAELELVAMDDPEGGPVSAARINADHILLEGTTRARHLFIDEALDIDESSGAFRMGKQSAVDLVNDGIYMGRTDDGGGALGFGFHAGRVSGGVEEYIQHTKSGGLRLKNATFLIGAGAATETVVLTNQTVSLVGKTSVSFTLMPGGGGGSSGYWADGAGGETGGNPGATGGTTTVVLKDGTTTIQTWTATGGTGGSGYGDGNGTQPTNPSSQPPYGNGGTGGAGQGYHTYEGQTSFYRAGKSGNPGITVQASTIDLTPYSDPKLEITIGAAGAGGAGTAGFFGGGAGGAGRVDYAASTTEDFLAAPVGLSPSATGTFFVTAGVAGTFPVLSPSRGLWVLNNCPTNWRVTPGAGNTEIWASHGTVSFISPSTPTWSTNASTTNEVRYHFFPM